MGVSLRENGPASSPQYQAPHRHNGGSEHAPEFATSINMSFRPCRTCWVWVQAAATYVTLIPRLA